MKKRRPPPWRQKNQAGKHIEPPLDNLEAERQQFINLRLEQAIAAGQSRNWCQIIEHAKVDWLRLQRTESQRQAKTVSLQDLLTEPTARDQIEPLIAAETLRHILASIDTLLGEALRLRFLEGHQSKEAARQLGITNRMLRSIIAKAFQQARNVPTW